jgi:carbamoyltransferase
MHDPALAVIEGDRIFAEGIERHTQCKRSWEMTRFVYSARAIRAAMQRLGIEPLRQGEMLFASSWSDLEATAQSCGLNWIDVMTNPAQSPEHAMLYSQIALEPLALNQLRTLFSGRLVPGSGRAIAGRISPGLAVTSRSVAHHLAHAAAAVFTSPFHECAVLVADGAGEGAALSVYDFHDGVFELLHRGEREVSLGFLYSGITEICGFDPQAGEEWKMMGLAAYGKPRDEIYDFFAERMVVDGLRLETRFDHREWPLLERMVGGFREPGSDDDALHSADLAHGFQRAFEDTVITLVRNLRAVSRSPNLAFVGGCALNSSLNGKLLGRTGFERLHVPSAPADDGNALGAALYLKHVVAAEPRTPELMSPYLGSTIEPESVRRILSFGGTRYREAENDEALCSEVAEMLAAGRIVGWVQGCAEYGPRALGNRSILADPRSPHMKQRINDRVKFRETYRPLAPSILHEFGSEYFEDYQESPYMERALVFRGEVRERVPAVVHVDGTGRLQTVKRAWNPLFHALIQAFHWRTGVPLLLNTSFNVMGKPIIHSAEDAITVFYTSGLESLVIGRFILEK